MALSYRELSDFLQSRRDTLFQYFSQITRYGLNVFIDSFDQSLHETFPDNRDIWTNGQLGLLEAAWQMHRQNPHLKVYCSIRQEAYTRYRSENTKAGYGNVLVLRYDRQDINRIFETQLQFYYGAASAADFFSLDIINNRRVGCEEPIQSYICRHTLGTPRSITIMGRELSMNRPPVHTSSDERESKVREVVNRVSGDEFCNYLQGEMEQFLDFLHDDGNRRLFFSRLPCNILTMRDLERIRDDVAAAKGLAPAHVHPFCEMFNLGLLGCLKVDALGDGRVQAFKKPSEFDWTMAGILPRQERLFFLHPSAQSTIRALNPSYFTYRGIVVGDGLLWSPANEELLRQQQIRIFITYCSAERRVVEGLEAELARAFDRRGEPHDIWRDRWRIRAGEPFQERIAEAVQAADYLLVVASEHSLRSGWVNAEWRHKYASEISDGRVRVIPLTLGKLDRAKLPIFCEESMRSPSRASWRSFAMPATNSPVSWSSSATRARELRLPPDKQSARGTVTRPGWLPRLVSRCRGRSLSGPGGRRLPALPGRRCPGRAGTRAGRPRVTGTGFPSRAPGAVSATVSQSTRRDRSRPWR